MEAKIKERLYEDSIEYISNLYWIRVDAKQVSNDLKKTGINKNSLEIFIKNDKYFPQIYSANCNNSEALQRFHKYLYMYFD